MARPKKGLYRKVKYEYQYDSGKGQSHVGERVKVEREGIILFNTQADILNKQFPNCGIKYELMEDEKVEEPAEAPAETEATDDEFETLSAEYLKLSGKKKVHHSWDVERLKRAIEEINS